MKTSSQITKTKQFVARKYRRRFTTWFDFAVVSLNSFQSSTLSNLKFCSRVELERDFKFEFELSKFAHPYF